MSSYSLRSQGKATSYSEPASGKRKKNSAPKKTANKKAKIETKTKKEHKKEQEEAEITEKGFIYFFYKPKVDETEVSNLSEVQRLYIVLWPQGHMYKKGEASHTSKNSKRIIAVPKKSLPSTSKHTKFFGVVDKVSPDLRDIDKELDEKDYETKNSGSRHLEGARPVGEGVYAIVKHNGHTHLAYVLELPKELGEAQNAMNIKHESSMIITVKNPKKSEHKGANFSSDLQANFGERAWNPVDPPEFLDYEGAEIILIGGSDDLVGELGHAGEELEKYEEIDAQRLTNDKLYKELHMTTEHHPIQPLLTGEWA